MENIAAKLLRCCLVILLLAGCAGPAPQGEIADLLRLPQDAWRYVNPAAADNPLLSPEQQEEAAQRFLEKHFGPWSNGGRPLPAEKAFAPLYALAERRVYGSNLLPYPEEEKARLEALCDVAGYPSLALRAVTVQSSDLRSLPTRRPGFANPRKAGEGFPFDYFQYSMVRPNTPLLITHRSADGAWYFVETSAAAGWLPTQDVALVDEDFVARFRTDRYLAVVEENVSLRDAAGRFRQQASIGAVLPLAGRKGQDWRVLIAAVDADGQAVIREGLLPAGAADPWPLPATPRTLATLINRLLDQPYGWGGLYGDRDCSATLQDLFAPIGIGLPRNSARQMERGRFVSFDGLAPKEKEQTLLARGVPFFTLVGSEGHILLYLGRQDGRAVVLHTLWGIRTRTLRHGDGRHVVGRTVITTLQPGLELPDLALPEGDKLRQITGISLLGETEK
jgi:cell wall-associated NlpC family hydrolase